jgi:hypothetical protein
MAGAHSSEAAAPMKMPLRVIWPAWLEPISKSPEEDNEAGELDEAEKVVGVVFPADEDATLPLYPGEEAFDQPTSHVTT